MIPPGVVAGGRAIPGGGGELPTVIGQAWGGGYFVGDFQDGANWFKLILAPKAAETSGMQWKNVQSLTAGTDSLTDGVANTSAMADGNHQAAQHCLDYAGDGYGDWYLVAKDELDFIYDNIRPAGASTPAIFKAGGSQTMDTTGYYSTSTQASTNGAWGQRFTDGFQSQISKTSFSRWVRPVRRVSFTP